MPKLHTPSRRTAVAWLACTVPLFTACRDEFPAKENALTDKNLRVFDVVLFSYLDYGIFDVFANGQWVGLAPAYGGGTGLITGVKLQLGSQKVKWRHAGTGETFTSLNALDFQVKDSRLTYLGIHIYPDQTVEYVASEGWPHSTDRGAQIRREAKSHGR